MEYIGLILSLVGVIGLILFTYLGARWLNKKTIAYGTKTKGIKILERVNLTNDKSLLIVNVGGKYLLMSMTAQSMEKIADLEHSDVIDILESSPPSTVPQNGSFLENLRKAAMEHNMIKPFIPNSNKNNKNKDNQGDLGEFKDDK